MAKECTTTATDTRTTELADALPPVACAPWCEAGDGHTDALHPDDQWCHSTTQRIGLSRYPLITWNDGRRSMDFAHAYLGRESDGSAYITTGYSETIGMNLTPDEALEYARVLTELAERARGE